MILVSVGTHEQGFERLVKKIDELAREGVAKDVIMQTGYTEYEPKYCISAKFYPFADMQRMAKDADIIITHGGPSSFIMALQNGKVPIVVPRRSEFNEHVNDHQVVFCHEVEKRNGNIIVVDDVDELGRIIKDFPEIVKNMPAELKSNNAEFCRNFENIALHLVGEQNG